MNAIITCNYCNKNWEQYVYTTSRTLKCSKCGETKSLVVKKVSEDKVDYYIGTPEFPLYIKEIDYGYDMHELTSNSSDIELTSD